MQIVKRHVEKSNDYENGDDEAFEDYNAYLALRRKKNLKFEEMNGSNYIQSEPIRQSAFKVVTSNSQHDRKNISAQVKRLMIENENEKILIKDTNVKPSFVEYEPIVHSSFQIINNPNELIQNNGNSNFENFLLQNEHQKIMSNQKYFTASYEDENGNSFVHYEPINKSSIEVLKNAEQGLIRLNQESNKNVTKQETILIQNSMENFKLKKLATDNEDKLNVSYNQNNTGFIKVSKGNRINKNPIIYEEAFIESINE